MTIATTHTNAYDEAITTPTEESVRRALAIQLIINKELGTVKNENPNQGSYFIKNHEFDRLTVLVPWKACIRRMRACTMKPRSIQENCQLLGVKFMNDNEAQEAILHTLFFERNKQRSDEALDQLKKVAHKR